MALGFTNFLVDAEVPQQLMALMQEHIQSPLSFLLLLNILLLILGAMLDIFAALVIMVPLLLPVAVGYGIHPVHLGIIFLANMQVGYFTPPVGMNLFIASYRFQKTAHRTVRGDLAVHANSVAGGTHHYLRAVVKYLASTKLLDAL